MERGQAILFIVLTSCWIASHTALYTTVSILTLALHSHPSVPPSPQPSPCQGEGADGNVRLCIHGT